MIKASELTAVIRTLLRDNFSGAKAYADDEVLLAINTALVWLVGADASASNTTASISLVEGIHQRIPEDGVRLLDIWSNDLGTATEEIDGVTYSGTAAVRYVDLAMYRQTRPDWGAVPAKNIVVNALFDPEDTTHFMVYPPNSGSGKLMASFSFDVATLTDLVAGEIDVAKVYQIAVANHALYSLLARDGEDQSSKVRSDAFFAKATESVQQILSANMATAPLPSVGV